MRTDPNLFPGHGWLNQARFSGYFPDHEPFAALSLATLQRGLALHELPEVVSQSHREDADSTLALSSRWR